MCGTAIAVYDRDDVTGEWERLDLRNFEGMRMPPGPKVENCNAAYLSKFGDMPAVMTFELLAAPFDDDEEGYMELIEEVKRA